MINKGYLYIYTSIKNRHKDWSHERIRQAAIFALSRKREKPTQYPSVDNKEFEAILNAT